MNFLHTKSNFILKWLNKNCPNRVRFYCQDKHVLQREQLTKIQSFCNICVNLSCSVIIKPLDVHQYPNNDHLKVALISSHHHDQHYDKDLIYVKSIESTNKVEIYSNDQNKLIQGAECLIWVPVKSSNNHSEIIIDHFLMGITQSLNVTSQEDITTIGSCNGNEMILDSINGNINVDKYQGDLLQLTAGNGDITIKYSAVASEITSTVIGKGSINIKRIQGVKAILKTLNGNINVDSSYCNSSSFICGNRGDLCLRNIHKNCKIHSKHGNLNLSGFDGALDVQLENGDADIQISQISHNSNINIKGGKLVLRLSENCQEKVIFHIISGTSHVDPSLLKLVAAGERDNADGNLLLNSSLEGSPVVRVDCDTNSVELKGSSFMEMFRKLQNMK